MPKPKEPSASDLLEHYAVLARSGAVRGLILMVDLSGDANEVEVLSTGTLMEWADEITAITDDSPLG